MTMNADSLPTRFKRRIASALAAAGLALAAAPSAHGAIAGDDNAELFAIVWDPVKEVSYSLDLGVKVNDFRINAQQDAGMQQFWKLSAADANFASLRALGTPVESLRWAVLAFDTQNDSFSPGDVRAFVTVQQGSAEGVLNPEYTHLLGLTNETFVAATNSMGEYVLNVSMTDGQSPNDDVSNFAYNGSSFDVKGTPAYFGTVDLGRGVSVFQGANVVLTNAVGKSSWFYGLTDTSYDLLEGAAVDEFDNIAHDGYFGLALNPADGSFALSYTLESASRTVAQREFALGIGRSEFNGGFAVRKLAYTDLGATPLNARDFNRRFTHNIGTPAFALPMSAVPEPQTWGLMLAGVLAVFARTHRRIHTRTPRRAT